MKHNENDDYLIIKKTCNLGPSTIIKTMLKKGEYPPRLRIEAKESLDDIINRVGHDLWKNKRPFPADRDFCKAVYKEANRWRVISEGELPEAGATVLLVHRSAESQRCKAGMMKYENGPGQPPTFYGLDTTNIRFKVTHWKPFTFPADETH